MSRNSASPSDMGIGVAARGYGSTGPSPVDLPSSGDPDDDWFRDQIIEIANWSRDEHEREFCNDAFLFYRWFRNYVDYGFNMDEFHAHVSSGLAYPFVKILSAKLMAVWQAGERIIDAQALDASGVLLAPRAEAWINHKLVNVMPRMFSKCELVKEAACGLGRGAMKFYVDVTPKQQLLRRKIASMMGIKLDEYLTWENVPEQRRINFDYVDPFNFWWVGSGRWFEECDFSVEQSYFTRSEGYRRLETKQFTKPFDLPEQGKGYDKFTSSRYSLDSGVGPGDQIKAGSRMPKPHQQVELQGRLEIRQTENGHPMYENRIARLVDMEYLANNEKLWTWNGKPSYIVFEPFLDHGGTRPIGVIESIEQLLYAHNDFLNMFLDNCRKIVDSTLLVDPGATKQKTLYLGPAEINWVRNPTQTVAPLQMKDIPRGVFEVFGGLSDMMQRIVGINDFFQGVMTSQSKPVTNTAKGMGLMAAMATDRFTPLLAKSGLEFYKRIAEALHETGKQFLTDEESVPPPNTGGDFTRVGPSDLDIPLKFSYKPKALDMAQDGRREAFVGMMEILSGMVGTMGPQQGLTLDLKETARILMDRFDCESDAEKILLELPMMPMGPGPGGPFATPGQPGSMPGAPMPPAGLPPGMPPPPPQ